MSGDKILLNTEWLCDCGGCHVALVDLHEKILQVLDSVEILKCPVLTDVKEYPKADIGILTGSIRTEHDRHAAEEMRKQCKTIIAFGTCAVYGGLHGAGLAHSREEIMDHVYKNSKSTTTDFVPSETVDELAHVVTPIDEVIDVDLYLPGCPPHAHFIFEALSTLIEQREPNVGQQTVCGRCRRVMKKTDVSEIQNSLDIVPDDKTCFLSQGFICLGSATLDRCLSPCPNHGVMCTGCAGPTMQILSEPTRDIRTEVSERMSRLTNIDAEVIKAHMEKSAKTHYAYAMATQMVGNKPTFLIQKWIADVEAQMGKTIKIDPVTRIEGHAKIYLDCDDSGAVDEALFCVNELRGFERILIGMEAITMPQVTARICGVCPTAHHLVSAKALDNAAGVTPPPAGLLLREFMYMGHVIHSHCLSLFVLAGPDLVFGLNGATKSQNIVGMVNADPDFTKKGLRLRSLGQKINETIGGRGIHPVTAVAGGISFKLNPAQFKRLQELTAEAVTLSAELAGKTKSLLFKLFDDNPVLLEKLNVPSWYLGTVKGGKLNLYDGDIRAVDQDGNIQAEFTAEQYTDHIVERAVTNSYAKEVYFKHGGAEHMYRVSTLARMNVVDGMETPLAQAEFEEFRKNFGKPCHNAIMQMYAKLIELVYACEKANEIINNPALAGETRVPAKFKGGRGVAHIEAPRGVLIHDYEIDEKGIVRAANMIIATQQNVAAINKSLKEGANNMLSGDDESMLNGLEFIVRCYDPCLACSTHAVGSMELDVEVRQNGKVVRKLRRDA